MSWLFPVLLLALFLAIVLCLLAESMWSNAIRFINVVFAALLAMNFWEPTAKLLENSVHKGGSYWWDFVSLWLLYALFITILQTVTNKISNVNVRFLAIANKIGGIVFACLTAAVLVSFANFTLHTAPLAEKAVQGGFPSSSAMSPDRQWAKFAQWVSSGSLASFSGSNEFNPRTFVSAYENRRRALQAQVEAEKGYMASNPPPR